jgi:hypothetical protein
VCRLIEPVMWPCMAFHNLIGIAGKSPGADESAMCAIHRHLRGGKSSPGADESAMCAIHRHPESSRLFCEMPFGAISFFERMNS